MDFPFFIQKRKRLLRRFCTGSKVKKFCKLASTHNCTVPCRSYLRKLLGEHLSKDNLDPEIKDLVEKTLIPWRKDILGNADGNYSCIKEMKILL